MIGTPTNNAPVDKAPIYQKALRILRNSPPKLKIPLAEHENHNGDMLILPNAGSSPYKMGPSSPKKVRIDHGDASPSRKRNRMRAEHLLSQ
mmetsp:Transcript_31014/g.28205  ORF Transcript_31014/g.28205 Transcript_31014/m.28205 type:complete len:91 (+) Transcript_31014:836-1108(+)